MKLKEIITTTLLVSAIIPFAQSYAQGKNNPPDLFDDFDVTQPTNKNLPPKVIAGRNHAVKVHFDLLASDTLTLDLYDGIVLTAVRDRLVDNINDTTTWFGHIEHENDSEVTLTVRGQAMTGTIRIGEDLYEIRFSGNKTHVISKVDASNNPEHPDIDLLTIETDEGSPIPDQETSSDIVAAGAATGTIVDIMVVYTPKARANASGIDGIESKIAHAVALTNQAYLNSKIDMQLNIVHMAEISYTESGNMATSLKDLSGKSDGKMDNVHNLRNTYAADQVVLVSAESNYCGYAWIMGTPDSSFESKAFSVIHDDSKYACISYNTLAHELGHNQGNVHNWENTSTSGAYSYSYGYRSCVSGGIKTIMSYPCSGATAISYFSNPNVFYGNEATGVSNSEDTARSMNNTKAIVAAWRSNGTTDTSLPDAPSNLLATALSDNEVILSWSDNTSNETGFRIEKSSDNASWTEIAVLGTNTQEFTDSGLIAATNYQYRVRSYNSNGNSDYSNISSTITQQAVCIKSTPSLAITPSTQYASSGELLTYNISLKNNDSSTCNIVTFTVITQDGETINSYTLSPNTTGNSTWNTYAPTSDGNHTVSVIASASGHNNATASSIIIIDSTAPTKPGNLTASVKRKSQVNVSWSASFDSGSGLKNYIVQRDGAFYITTSSTSFTDKPGSGTHTYTVLAQDLAGNKGIAGSVSVNISGSTKGNGKGKNK